MVVMIVSTCALASAMISIYLTHKSSSVRIPKRIRFVAFSVLAKLLFLRKEVPQHDSIFHAEDKLGENKTTNKVAPGKIDETKTSNKFNPGPEENNKKIMENVDSNRPKSSQKHMCVCSDDLQAMRLDLMHLNNIVRKKENESFIVDEWKCLGKVIDRLLFWLCTIISVITILSISSYE